MSQPQTLYILHTESYTLVIPCVFSSRNIAKKEQQIEYKNEQVHEGEQLIVVDGLSKWGLPFGFGTEPPNVFL